MKFDLKAVRTKYNKTKEEFCELIGISEQSYNKYEKQGEIPSKYLLLLWKNLEDFPLPDDFFLYTSFTMLTNMKYHNMTQKDIAEWFDISNQSTISGYMTENIPMYEKKNCFEKFDPLIIPMIRDSKDNSLKNITELKPRGNFILIEKRKQKK